MNPFAKLALRVLFAISIALVCVLHSNNAEAVVIKVWYRPNDAPACCTDVAQMTRVIQQVMQEWEQHSFGAVQFDWQGTTTVPIANLPDGSTHDKFVVMWDLTQQNGNNPCSQVEFRWPEVFGRIYMRPTVAWILNSSSISSWFGVDPCGEMRGVLTHEFGHLLRNEGHPDGQNQQSVLNDQGSVNDVAILRRHLWNADIYGVYNPWYPRRPVALSADLLSWDGSVYNAGGTVFPNGANHTGALGAGGPGYSYSRVYATDDHVWFQRGSGLGGQWDVAQELSIPGQRITAHRMCVAASSLTSDMIAMWVSSEQQYWVNGMPDEGTGTRPIVFVESHNGGTTWSVPSLLSDSSARTRTGLACQFDLLSNRFVVAFADKEERIRTMSRTPVAGAVWSGSTVLSSVLGNGHPLRTGSSPALSFDEFDYAHDVGLLTWWDADVNDQRAMWIRFSQAQGLYVHASDFLNDLASSAEEEVLRTTVVPNVILGARNWAFGTQALNIQGRWRRRVSAGGALETNADFLNIITSQYFDWYVGSAANRQYFETAYLRHIAYTTN